MNITTADVSARRPKYFTPENRLVHDGAAEGHGSGEPR
jgi:hypothetical protein